MPMACLNSCAVPLLQRGHTSLGPCHLKVPVIVISLSIAVLWKFPLFSERSREKANIMKGREEMYVEISSCMFINKLNTLVK